MPKDIPVDSESIEVMAHEFSALATREAETMPPGWSDAHKLYSDAADTLRALSARVEELARVKAKLEAAEELAKEANGFLQYVEEEYGESDHKVRHALTAFRTAGGTNG